MDCPSCGTPPDRPEQRFCAKCGTNLAPAEPPTAYGQGTRITGPLFADDLPPPPAAPPTFVVPTTPPPSYPPVPPPPAYDARQHRRGSTPVVLLAVAALFAAAIGAGGVVLLFGGDDDSPSGTSAEDRANTSGRDATTDAGPSTPAGQTPTATETETKKPATFQCWDGGAAVSRLADCTPPTGATGLAWVFPSATGATCSIDAGAQRASEADCAPTIGDDTVRFHYSEWRSRASLETYYGGNMVASIGAPGGRADLVALQVASRDSSVGYKVAIYYADPTALWSVTVYASDESQYQSVIDQLVMRPFKQLRGAKA